MNSLRKTVERLQKIVIDMCKNSVQSSNMRGESRSSVRKIKKKHKENEKSIEKNKIKRKEVQARK